MAKTFYGDQIEALKIALDYCRQGGCENAIPYITMRIRWMQQNDWELSSK